MTFPPDVLPLASISAMRPVFLIIMGVFLLLTAWRITRGTTGWSPRLLMAGAMMLATGYSVIIPLYNAGILIAIPPSGFVNGDAATAMAWECLKLVTLNGGWLVFGMGLAIHAGVFETEKSVAPIQVPHSSSHEPIH
ncbi:hypothetical protein [Luteolibacter sp. Populi]|uniref:hypothetical protein n=1 Tax=Luteolibacter sp. Populi TaxID=3230487 RepID=UPI003465BEFE